MDKVRDDETCPICFKINGFSWPQRDTICWWVHLILLLKVEPTNPIQDDLTCKSRCTHIANHWQIVNSCGYTPSAILLKQTVWWVAYQADINRFPGGRNASASYLEFAWQHSKIKCNGFYWLVRWSQPYAQVLRSYDELSQHLREIVRDLKNLLLCSTTAPKHALDELADNLMEQSGDKVRNTVCFFIAV